MPDEPQIKALSMRRRRWFFRLLLVIFLLALPVVIFYTTGYRLSFEDDTTNIVTTGGMYVDTSSTDVQVFLNEEQYDRPRLFQSAYYLQNITAGQQRIVVQAPGTHTWVKELPVYPRIVTEASAFNVPVTPQLRPITEFQTSTGTAVYFDVSTSSIFGTATATEPFVIATSAATTGLAINPEYTFVDTLFASGTATKTSVFADDRRNAQRFRFLTVEERLASTSTTTEEIIERNDMRLIERDFELYARSIGQPEDVPYYFCVSSSSYASTSEQYGEHVAEAIFTGLEATSSSSTVTRLDNRICRTEIKLDRLRKDVYAYDFYPDSDNLVLLHLTDGLYVTEIDDRAWQNTQPLLSGNDFTALVENDVIYIKRGNNYFELLPEIIIN